MKNFKNSFGVQSDSVALLQAFIKEAEAAGWINQGSTATLEVDKKLYFRGVDGKETGARDLNMGHFWNCNMLSGSTYHLPVDWDDAIEAMKEVPKVPAFNKGDLLNITSTGGFFTTHPVIQSKYPDYNYNNCKTGTFEFVEFITVNDDTLSVIVKDTEDKIYCVACDSGVKKATAAQKKKYLAELEATKNPKIGDVVIITERSGSLWSSASGGKCPNGKVEMPFIGKLLATGEDSINVGWYGFCTDNIKFRKATPNESVLVTSMPITFGDHSGIIYSDGTIVMEDYEFNMDDIGRVIDYFERNTIEINGYEMVVESANISFGCKSGTLEDAYTINDIYNRIKANV